MPNPLLRLPPHRRLPFLAAMERDSTIVIIVGAALLLLGELLGWLRYVGIALIVLGIIGWLVARKLRRQLIVRAQMIKAQGDVQLRQKLFDDKPHEHRVISREQFPAADYYFYDNTQKLLEARGFVFLGDVENTTISKILPRQRTFNRIMRSADATVVAEIRHNAPLREGMPGRYSIAFHSELSDGFFLVTNNSAGKGIVVDHDNLSSAVFLRQQTLPEELLRIHLETVELNRILKPHLTLTKGDSVDAAIQMDKRLHTIVSRREKEQGFRKIDPKLRAARRILDHQKALWASGPHEFRHAALTEFPNLNHAFYDRFLREFSALGFVHLLDKENLTLSRVYPHMRTLVRIVRSLDGTTIAAAYHIRNIDIQAENIDIDTQFTDGTFISTTTAREQYAHPPEIDSRHVPAGTSFTDILAIHQQRVQQKLQNSPDLKTVLVNSEEDYVASANRQHEIKARFKIAKGLFNEDDMRKIRGRELTPHELAIVDEVEKLKVSQDPAPPHA